MPVAHLEVFLWLILKLSRHIKVYGMKESISSTAEMSNTMFKAVFFYCILFSVILTLIVEIFDFRSQRFMLSFTCIFSL